MKYNLLQDLLRFKPIYCDVYLIYYFTVYSSYQLMHDLIPIFVHLLPFTTALLITIYKCFSYKFTSDSLLKLTL